MAELLARPSLPGRGLQGRLNVTERDCAILGVSVHRGGLEALQDAVQARWGVMLPHTPRRVVAGDLAFVWSGPEKWLIVADRRDDSLLQTWQSAIDARASLVELGDGRCVLSVSGGSARPALTHLLPIDLHPRAFSTGSCALTLAGHINVQLWQTDEAPAYELVVARSFADSLLHHLSVIASAL